MMSLAAGMAVAPLTVNCLLGCASLFLAAAILDAFAAKDGSGRMKVAGLWLLRGGWVLLTAMLAYQGLHAHALPIGSTPEKFGPFMRTEVDKWRKVIKSSGITVD